MHRLRIKRVYDVPATTDGTRVLVDRLWPRGLRKEQARIDHWIKDIAPSNELRKWYGHDDSRWEEFKRRYFDELIALDELVTQLRALINEHTVTLLYSARSVTHNNAVALADFLREK
ncbi:MAG TPA: DUF488 domain-containing protein [Chromatiales bacterium]|nr:DUF488 domain-containing protein [Chromatiales bacterium]